MYSLSQSLTVLFILLAGAAILVWQYRARQTRLGRIAAIAYFAIVVLLGHLPMSVWYAIQHAMSPQSVEADVARFQPAIPKFDWNRPVSDNGTLTVPLEIQGLPAGWSVELNGWNGHQVSSAGDPDTIGMLLTAPNLTGQDANREAKLIVSGGFARRHRTDSVDLSIQTEVTIYGPPVTYALPVDTQQFIPGVGRCTAASSPFLYLGCQAAVEPEYRVDARWAIDSSSGKPLVLISHVEDRSPIRLVPTLKPIFSMTGGFGAQSDYTKGHINITLRKPVAHVQRTLAVSGRFFEKN